MKPSREDYVLYAITDRNNLKVDSLELAVKDVLKAGVKIIQLREKELSYEEFLKVGKLIKSICKEYGATLIINDNIQIAVELGADGVHIGQSDMSLCEVKKIAGDMLVGVSVKTVEEAKKAELGGADYLGVGAVFPTGTKLDADKIDFETLEKICKNVSIPVLAIGGINLDNLHLLKDTGITGVAVVSAIFSKKDIELNTKKLLDEARRCFINE